MGVVWVARNAILEVDVAIKLIPLKKGANRTMLAARLLQEARAAAQLAHPAICRTFDFGATHHGDPFVVSELLHGETLSQALREQGRIPAVRAVQTLLPIADGLAEAHARGIVHRDVKPDNIFLVRDLASRVQPKLLDFGLAHFVDQGSKLTVAGTLLGTPDYMSPEQARGELTDFGTDIWSLCVVLYELMTGRLPFAGNTHTAIIWGVMSRDPEPTTASAAGDQALWRIIEQGLRKEAKQRWKSVRKLGQALALWLSERGVQEDLCGASLRAAWLELESGTCMPTRLAQPSQEEFTPLSRRLVDAPIPSSGDPPAARENLTGSYPELEPHGSPGLPSPAPAPPPGPTGQLSSVPLDPTHGSAVQ
jgi:serine/threonine protein kinase